MRIRRNPSTREKIRQYPDLVIMDYTAKAGHWRDTLPYQELFLEIGMGHGTFINNMAKAYPNTGFVGVDIKEELVYDAVEQVLAEPKPNLRLLWLEAQLLKEVFAPGELSGIYLTFSDPWPKVRHAKRRLTHDAYCRMYWELLAPNGRLYFKTDGADFFAYSVQSLERQGFSVDVLPEAWPNNLATEYEMRYLKQNIPIHYLIAAKEKE